MDSKTVLENLDRISGCQMAMVIPFQLMLLRLRNDAALQADFLLLAERAKANLLASQASEIRIQAFDETLAEMLQALTPAPG
jgi:hypothetical protein